MKALVTNRMLPSRVLNLVRNKPSGPGGQVTEVSKPTITANEILVKVRFVALNPTDFKHLDIISPPGSIIGCDYTGEVAEVGANSSKTWKVGERVAGTVHGGLYPDRGSFTEYLKVDADLAWHIPAEASDADATTYGVSAVTAVLTLNIRLGPRQELSYGADAVFDYHSASVAQDIIKEYPNISKAVDCYSEGQSTKISAEVVKDKGGKVMTLLPNSNPKVPGVTVEMVLAYTMLGRPFQWLPPVGPKYAANPDDRQGLVRFYSHLPRFTKWLKPLPVTISEDGFDGILTDLDKLRQKQVSGTKLVVKF